MAALNPGRIVQAQQMPHLGFNSDGVTGTTPDRPDAKETNVRLNMAYVNTTRTVSVSFSDRFSALLKVAFGLVERRRIYSQTVFELNSLSDRDLADLGISRSAIGAVARDAAYNN